MRKNKTRIRAGARGARRGNAHFVDIGDRTLVIMDEEEYEHLQDLADAAEARRIKADASDPVLTWDQIKDRFIRNRITEVRDRLGVSQRELARRLGVRPSTVSRWERKEANLTLGTVRKIALALRAEVPELIS